MAGKQGFIEQDRERKPSTLRDCRAAVQLRLLPAFGPMAIEEITTERIEQWRASLGELSNRSKNKLLIILHGAFRRAQTAFGLAKVASQNPGELKRRA